MGMLGMSRRRCAGHAAAIRRSGVGGAISISHTAAAEGTTAGTMQLPSSCMSGTCTAHRWGSGRRQHKYLCSHGTSACRGQTASCGSSPLHRLHAPRVTA